MKPLVEFIDAEGRQRSYYLIETARTYTVEYQLGDDYSFRHRVTVEYSREVAIRSLAALALPRVTGSYDLKIHCPEVKAAMNAIHYRSVHTARGTVGETLSDHSHSDRR
jgi:hypothetical protein